MGLMAELTYIHLQAFTAVDQIERRLNRLKYEHDHRESMRRNVDETAALALRLRRDLDDFFNTEREELFPRVRRIFGGEMREARQLARYQDTVLDALDHFLIEMTGEKDEEPQWEEIQPEYLDLLFSEFVEHYEERCALERTFYERYSSILFPGGVSTD